MVQSVAQVPPKTFDQRVAWAINGRTAFVVGNEETRSIKPPTFDEYDNEEDIQISVQTYENKVARLEERIEKEKRERQKEEAEKALQELLQMHPVLEERVVQPNEVSTLKSIQKRLLPDSDDDGREMELSKHPKSRKTANKAIRSSRTKYEVPCEQCISRGRGCHEQDPPLTSCYECRKSRVGCSFVTKEKKVPRRETSKNTKETAEESDDEIVRPLRSTFSNQSRIVDAINNVASEINNMTQAVIEATTNEMKSSNKILETISVNLETIANAVRVKDD